MALKLALAPAVNVTGKDGPLKLNPPPLAAAPEMVSDSPPLFVTATCTLLLEPTVTFPKFTLAGLAVKALCVRPVPESGMLNGEFDASDTMLNVPLADPAAAGLKIALNETLWLALRVTGRVRPLIEKPFPLALACEIVTELPPVLVRVSDRVLLVST